MSDNKEDDKKTPPTPVDKSLTEIQKEIKNIDSVVTTEQLKRLEKLADPKLRLNLISQLFYMKKIAGSEDFHKTMNMAIKSLQTLIPDLPYEKLILAIETVGKAKEAHDKDIQTFLTETKKAESTAAKVSVNLDNRDQSQNLNLNVEERQEHKSVKELIEQIPAEKSERVLRLAEKIVDFMSKKSAEDSQTKQAEEESPPEVVETKKGSGLEVDHEFDPDEEKEE